MATASGGNAASTAPRPIATASVIAPIPTAVPTICGSVRRKPKAAPDAHSRMLLGPGVPALRTENATSDASSFTGDIGGRRAARGLVRSGDGNVVRADGDQRLEAGRSGRSRGTRGGLRRARVPAAYA